MFKAFFFFRFLLKNQYLNINKNINIKVIFLIQQKANFILCLNKKDKVNCKRRKNISN